MIDLPNFNSREEVLETLGEIVQLIGSQGYFITGSIEVDFRRTCEYCDSQKQQIRINSGIEEVCLKCVERIKMLAAPETTPSRSVKDLEQHLGNENPIALLNCDAKICIICGGLAYRTGTCYTCSNCGGNEGCG